MQLVTQTKELEEFCQRAAKAPYVAVDTEFERESRYFAKLCLIQLAFAGDGAGNAILIDGLSKSLNLAPLDRLLVDPDVVKVFHAGRQDIEIFHNQRKIIPQPLFDTQIAGMVCGLGASAGFQSLLRAYGNNSVERSQACTDWSSRPLTSEQLQYALDDVVQLCPAYEAIYSELSRTGRLQWIAEELRQLADPATYRFDPVSAVGSLRLGNGPAEIRMVALELLTMREDLAQRRNRPRNWILRNDHLVAIAKARPRDVRELRRHRLLPQSVKSPPFSDQILAAVRRGASRKPEARTAPDAGSQDCVNPASLILIRTLLEDRSRSLGVAAHLIASSSDLKKLASGQKEGRLMEGWRFEIFGKDAMRLHSGTAALTVDGSDMAIVPV